jgi:hypothetical protein
MFTRLLISTLVLSFSTVAYAADDCSKALIPANMRGSMLSVQDLSIASTLSRDAYNEMKQHFSGDAVVYYVPVGANYDDYQKNISSLREAFQLNNFDLYSSAYASSALNDQSLQAYRACLAGNRGLAIVAERIGDTKDSSYDIWITYAPYPAQMPVTGTLLPPSNLSQASTDALSKQITQANYNSGFVDFEVTIVPADPNKDAAVTVQVGPISRTLHLPPLIVPQPTTKSVQLDAKPSPLRVAAGYSAGHEHDSTSGCIVPDRPEAKFIVGTAQVIETHAINAQQPTPQNKSPNSTLMSQSPDQICASLQANNTSGTNTTEVYAQISAQEVWFEMPK